MKKLEKNHDSSNLELRNGASRNQDPHQHFHCHVVNYVYVKGSGWQSIEVAPPKTVSALWAVSPPPELSLILEDINRNATNAALD